MAKSSLVRLLLALVLFSSSLVFIPPGPVNADNSIQDWQPVSVTAAPAGRRSHVSVWTGSEMIIWGGQTENGYNQGCSDNDGARYNPATDSWTTISSVNAPARRREARAVWTGSEMIVWGGEECNSNATYNDGGRYNPATDTWTAMTIVNAPTGRYVHTAVWTGTEMIVWGGDAVSPGVLSLNDGGRYNPATDTWTAISTAGAPSPKSHPTSVWTGTKMIVWGGSDDCCGPASDVPGGGIYNPATDSWSNMSAGSPNAGFKFHSSAWTGTEMVVWGGHDTSGAFTNVGQRYNPATDTWTNMSTLNAPSARGYMDGVWAGSAFFVWGGYDGSVPFLSTGGLYDPVTDTWTPIISDGAPANRDVATLVWTGSSVILWGGFNYDGSNSYFRGDGGVFNFGNNASTSPDISDFVVLGTEGVWLKQGTLVTEGSVGANTSSTGPYLDASVEVSIGQNVSIPNQASVVYGDSIKLKSGSSVYSATYNDMVNNGTIIGTATAGLTLPVVATMPAVPTFTPGLADVNVAASTAITLNPGSYRNLTALHDAQVTFAGGVYEFASWDLRDDVHVYFTGGPTEVRIAGKLSTNARVALDPVLMGGTSADEVRIVVGGTNGNTGNVGATPKAAQFGMANAIAVNVYVPNGTLYVREQSHITGAFIGRWVVIGENAEVHWASGF